MPAACAAASDCESSARRDGVDDPLLPQSQLLVCDASPSSDPAAARTVDDFHHLLTGAIEQEQRIERLLRRLEDGMLSGRDADGELLRTVRKLATVSRAHREAAETVVARSVASSGPKPSERTVILVVDDVRDSRDTLALILEASGFHTFTAGDGPEIVLAHNQHPAVILMDLEMPVLNGSQAAYLLRASVVTRHIKIVSHSAGLTTDDPRLGPLFDAALVKPSSSETMIAVSRRLLGPNSPTDASADAGRLTR